MILLTRLIEYIGKTLDVFEGVSHLFIVSDRALICSSLKCGRDDVKHFDTGPHKEVLP